MLLGDNQSYRKKIPKRTGDSSLSVIKYGVENMIQLSHRYGCNECNVTSPPIVGNTRYMLCHIVSVS